MAFLSLSKQIVGDQADHQNEVQMPKVATCPNRVEAATATAVAIMTIAKTRMTAPII